MIEFVGGELGGEGERSGLPGRALSQGGFEVADALFHAAVVAGK